MVLRWIQETNNHEHEKDQRIIEGPYSQTAPDIKILEIAFRLLCVDEDAGNQKAGQYKKKVDSHPPAAEQLLRIKQGIFQTDVVHHHDQNRQAANGIELWNSSLHCLCRARWIGAVTAGKLCVISVGSSGSWNP